ncbi:MAG TPA: DUF1629 domain-containing protein [Myxococcaceae bacterium]|nr:DUF1629 domain-containing protein [Myxococcaceae bacterium]
MNYLIARSEGSDGACVLGGLREVDDLHEFQEGVSRAANFPDDANFRMSPSFPKDIRLEDAIHNMDMLLVASERVKKFLEAEKVPGQEMLPVTIFNHKGRKEKAPYFVIHQVGLQDCIDLKKTKWKKNPLDDSQITDVRKLTLDEKKIDKKAQLFRLKSYGIPLVIRADLAEKIKKAGFTGFEFIPLIEWTF